jgi:hypothetical protein
LAGAAGAGGASVVLCGSGDAAGAMGGAAVVGGVLHTGRAASRCATFTGSIISAHAKATTAIIAPVRSG